MRTTMLNPSTTDLVLSETCRLVVRARPATAKVARDAVAAFLAGTGHHPHAVEDARTCVSDAVAYILNRETQAVHMTVTARVVPQGVTVTVEDRVELEPTTLLGWLTPTDLGKEPLLAVLRRVTLWCRVSPTWGLGRRGTRVTFELSSAGRVHA
ncbi:hypothetical protein LE181_01910 [Streptomyces sp. SCA3-4]|uniref:ATP-binding protein n=1 Tax=Streptomyces sichuanensis TaxID=2871810 RepID=UPI001CE2DB7D|nr:hypothetical protein [Streptomyces sichuanensis]MCA6090930.1 hypothetical protein [Streptomyces sichuanensis]